MKKNILLVLLGMVIMAGTMVIADTLNASEIDYKETNVGQALDSLYTRAFKTYTVSDVIYSSNQGNGESSKTTSVTLDKGKYLIYTASVLGWPATGTVSNDREATGIPLTCSDCNPTLIYGWINESHSTNIYAITQAGTNLYSATSLVSRIYYVEILEDDTVVTAPSTTNNSNPSALAQVISMQAVKVD